MIWESDEGVWSASTSGSIGLWESMIAVATGVDLLGTVFVVVFVVVVVVLKMKMEIDEEEEEVDGQIVVRRTDLDSMSLYTTPTLGLGKPRRLCQHVSVRIKLLRNLRLVN
jgi:hypothetical protein